MKNYLTQREYTGENILTLESLGFNEDDSFVTFKQALKIDGITGQSLKGLKKAATLFFYKEEKDKETGKKKSIRKYFTVFNAAEVLTRIETNKAA